MRGKTAKRIRAITPHGESTRKTKRVWRSLPHTQRYAFYLAAKAAQTTSNTQNEIIRTYRMLPVSRSFNPY